MICRRRGIGIKAHNVIGFIVVFVGTVMSIGGLCILVMSLLRR